MDQEKRQTHPLAGFEDQWMIRPGEPSLVSFVFGLNWLRPEIAEQITPPLINLALEYHRIEGNRHTDASAELYHVHGLVSAFAMTYMLSQFHEEIDGILKKNDGQGLTAGVYYDCIAAAMLHDLGGNMKAGEKEAGAQTALLRNVIEENCLHELMNAQEISEHTENILELQKYTGYHEGVNPCWYGFGDGRWRYNKEMPFLGKLVMIADWNQMTAYNYPDKVAQAFLHGDKAAYRFKTALSCLFVKGLEDVALMINRERILINAAPEIHFVNGAELIPPVMRNRFIRLITNFVWYDLSDMARVGIDQERRLTPDEFVIFAMKSLGLDEIDVIRIWEEQDKENELLAV